MARDNTQRFSSKVADYVANRPVYAEGCLEELSRRFPALSQPGAVIVDVGSGTGILTKQLIECFDKAKVIGVEPNGPMGKAAEDGLSEYIKSGRFESILATAEKTTLPDKSADLVIAGTAFHWFDPAPTREEWQRILKPDGHVVLVWNARVGSESLPQFMSQANDIMKTYAGLVEKYLVSKEEHEQDRARIRPEQVQAFFGGKRPDVMHYANYSAINLKTLQGRFMSTSYAPSPGVPPYDEIMEELEAAFRRDEKDGLVEFQHMTLLITGEF